MCGICGLVNFKNYKVKEETITDMLHVIKHRGPDSEGVFIEKNIGLGFVRLSIIDLSPAGDQPMLSSDSRFIIVFNGEIFNYIELRNELKNVGYHFNTNTDTEVLLTAYIHWGEKCMDHFNGMWAFVIYDKLKNEIFGCRDRFGVKPLYYCMDDKQFTFASDIPPILKVISEKPKMNELAVFDYMVYNRTDQDENTFFKSIKKLQHGYYFRLYLSDNRLSLCRWYDLKSNLKDPFASPDEYLDMLRSSVELRLRSDVTLGVCLSGGLDSSSIVSIISRILGEKDLSTFSAIYGIGENGDESVYINEYRSELSRMHFIKPSAESFLKDIPDFISAHSEPVPTTSPYAQFKVMELAKKFIVVTLDGQGADEQLAGYHYFFGFYFKDLFQNLKWIKLSNECASYLTKHRSLSGFYYSLYFMLPAILQARLKTLQSDYLQLCFKKKYQKQSSVASSLFSSTNLNGALLDHFEHKLEHLLKWEDRNSMWFSLEARTPFLDYRLVERTLSLQSYDLINKGMTKSILREATKGIVPDKIRLRNDKIGFGTPQGEWFRTDQFQKYIMNVLNSRDLHSLGIINIHKAKTLYQEHIRRKSDFSNEIWKCINLNLWFQKYFL